MADRRRPGRHAVWAGRLRRPGAAWPARDRVSGMSKRVLLLSWEYPPVIEGGLARHVRKLAEALVRQGVCVDVLTRGVGEAPRGGQRGGEELAGVAVHRVREPSWPRDLHRFVAWVEQMNGDMLAAGGALAEDNRYDLIHGHDWLVAQ